jgi:hypothetical protein
MGERRKDMDFPTLTVDAAGFQKIDFSRFMVNFASPTFKIAVFYRFQSIIIDFRKKMGERRKDMVKKNIFSFFIFLG